MYCGSVARNFFFFSQSSRLEKHVHVRKAYYIRKVGGSGGVSVGQKKKEDRLLVFNFQFALPLIQ